MKKLIAFFSLICITIIGCKNDTSKTFEVNVNITNLGELVEQNEGGQFKAFLYSITSTPNLEPIQLDSITFDESTTSFKLKGVTDGEGIYDIFIENGPIIPLINDVPSLTVNIDLKSDIFYTIEGSPLSNDLSKFLIEYAKYDMALENSIITLDSLKHYGASDAVKIAATENKNLKLGSFIQFLEKSLNEVKNGSIGVFILGKTARLFEQSKFEESLNQMSQKFPENTQIQQIKSSYFQFKEQNELAQKQVNASAGSWTGLQVPNLTMLDPNNKKISISDFKGKWVLIDFWASWCFPCRTENPNIVKAFKKYKDKNFTVLGVSLDQQKDNWVKAIQEDQLFWPQMSDLKFWNSEAVSVFKMESIPYNVLVNPEGIIVAESLLSEKLHATLSSYLD